MTKPNLHWFFAHFSAALEELPCLITLEDPGLAHHIKGVMRLRSGEHLVLVSEAEQQPYLASLDEVKENRLTLKLLEKLSVSHERKVERIAAVALLKGPKWDWVLQKLAELGVSEIIPLQTRRTVVAVKDSAAKEHRWTQIIRQAAEQSEQVRIPRLHQTSSPEELVSRASMFAECFKIAAIERAGVPLQNALQSKEGGHRRILFAIGPEGGWDPEEAELLQSGGFLPVSLGDTILRSETAALYLASVIDYATSP